MNDFTKCGSHDEFTTSNAKNLFAAVVIQALDDVRFYIKEKDNKSVKFEQQIKRFNSGEFVYRDIYEKDFLGLGPYLDFLEIPKNKFIEAVETNRKLDLSLTLGY